MNNEALDKLLIDLATPANAEEAARMLSHPLVQAFEFCDARATTRDNADRWHRLAGTLRSMYRQEVSAGRA